MLKAGGVRGGVCSLGVAVLLLAGCGGSPHVPASGGAKAALEAALGAWREGKAVGEVEGTKPRVVAMDGRWRDKKKLAAFEIVGEEPTTEPDAPRKFKVRLTLEGSPPADEVYRVFGKDPVYVYRDQDYQTEFSKM